MKQFFWLSSLFILFSMVHPATAMTGKKPPPERLVEMMKSFPEIEEAFEEGEWQEAQKRLAVVKKSFDSFSAKAKKDLSRDTVVKFRSLIIEMKKNLGKQDQDATEDSFIGLMKGFFVIAENYQFDIPPVLSTILKYLDEAKEGLEENNFEEVVSEMVEIEAFFNTYEVLFEEHVSNGDEIEAFILSLYYTKKYARQKDKEKAASSLEDLEGLTSKFTEYFKN